MVGSALDSESGGLDAGAVVERGTVTGAQATRSFESASRSGGRLRVSGWFSRAGPVADRTTPGSQAAGRYSQIPESFSETVGARPLGH